MPSFESRILKSIPSIEHQFGDSNTPRPQDAHWLKQVHGDEIRYVSEVLPPAPIAPDRVYLGSVEIGDGLFTTKPGLFLCIQTADCLPVLLADQSAHAVFAIHAGWRGVEKGILLRTDAFIKKERLEFKNISAAIGPSIGPCCFEVSTEIAELFKKRWGVEVVSGPEKRHVNLWRTAEIQLQSLGIQSIDTLKVCTYCGGSNLESYRRATHQKITSGRQWSFIRISC